MEYTEKNKTISKEKLLKKDARKSGSLETKHKEMREVSRLLHSPASHLLHAKTYHISRHIHCLTQKIVIKG